MALPGKIGSLRHRITIEENDDAAVDEYNEPVERWKTCYANIPAEVIQPNGSERKYGDQMVALYLHIITVRFIDGIHEGMRVIHQGRTLNIEAVLDSTGRRRKLELHCKEIPDG